MRAVLNVLARRMIFRLRVLDGCMIGVDLLAQDFGVGRRQRCRQTFDAHEYVGIPIGWGWRSDHHRKGNADKEQVERE